MRSQIFWIDAPLQGRIAIMARPRGGEWLTDEVVGWRDAGVDTLICLLEPDEIRKLGLGDEAALCERAGIEYVAFPLRDRGVPASIGEAQGIASLAISRIKNGGSVAIHCRAGIGRSAVVAASTLVLDGLTADDALERIGRARGVSVPDTDEQRRWVIEYEIALKP